MTASAPLVDGRGCLTDAGFAAVEAAPVGEVPSELAAHLAGCARCQKRLLGGGAERPPGRGRPAPSLGRMLVMVGLVLLAILGFMVSLRWLAAPGP